MLSFEQNPLFSNPKFCNNKLDALRYCMVQTWSFYSSKASKHDLVLGCDG